MKPSKSLIFLSILAGLLAAVQSGLGLFWQAPGSPFSFTTLRGDVVEMAGSGLYWYDTYFKAPINRGTDAVTLFFSLPLLIAALVLYRHSALRGNLMLVGVLSYLLYNSASVSLGVAYNNLFLLYTAYFSASLFAFILAFATVDWKELSTRVSAGVPRKGIAALMFLSAAGLLAAWLPDIIATMQTGLAPHVSSYTTLVTHVFDLGIIVPCCFLAGVLILRRAPLGTLLSTVLLILLVIIGVTVSTQTVFQSMAGITLGVGEFIGKAGSFMLLSLIAVGLVIRLFRAVDKQDAAQASLVGAMEV